MPATFDILPDDVLEILLESVGSRQDLASLIRTSNPCRRVFQYNPAHFLQHTSINELPVGLLREVAAVYAAKMHFPPVVTPEQASGQPARAEEFFNDYFSTSPSFPLPTSKQALQEISTLLEKVRYLSGQFALHAIREAKALRKGMTMPFQYDTHDVTRVVHLSDSEKFRLHRALLRFELLCVVFRIPHRKKELLWFGQTDQCRLFLDRFEPFEVEEVLCIYSYFRHLLYGTMYQTHRLLFEAVQTLNVPQAVDTVSAIGDLSSAAPPQPRQLLNNVVQFRFLQSTTLGVFARFNKHSWSAWFGIVASLGLDFIFEFARRDRNLRFKMIRSQFFHQLLGTPLIHFTVQFCLASFHGPPAQFAGTPEDPRFINTGYPVYMGVPRDGNKWFNSEREHKNTPFMAIGLVFWDTDRIASPPMRGGVAAAVHHHFPRRYHPWAWANSYHYRGVYSARLQERDLKALERYFGLTTARRSIGAI
ncbi:hypothetical protein NQ176_g8549 [Zarea fungicola]|uniref:Uncharacterized protein n=1 Tax=Zarea fungicola TaxID=93591 RepID=A0ACC1MTY7_9HYPO|nr:hypothetical protein NQ176_g8549 [Lecanicillium fungicola]